MSVDILDVGSGNIQSVRNWIEKANIPVRIVSKASDMQSNLLILPGVGSAGPYIKRLRHRGCDQAILEHVDKGGRLLGICLGFQILCEYSEEDDGTKGLNLIEGHVERLPRGVSHNSWEPIRFRKNGMNGQSFNAKERLSRRNILDGRVFYNHEYGVVNNNNNSFSIPVSETLSKYTGLYVSSNIIGMQFHPEKSQITGLELLSMVL